MRLPFQFTFILIGFLVAISFFEAPLKFQAPSITIPLGVEIGEKSSSLYHSGYMICEVFKLILLIFLSIYQVKEYK
ncbi:MAG: hypothetical protein COB15_01340 [Flavobacteriales bacterium]|nr:MAG: hypothetical protein COB15_01340 [Flavobacteriales bacterium]